MQLQYFIIITVDVHAVIGKPSPTGSWFQVLLAAQQDDAVPIRRQYKQLLEYDTENPVALATAAKSPETREKYSGELDDAGKPVIISHNYKEHHLSAKDRQQIFEAPFHLLNADKGEVTYYQIASPFRRHDFRLPKDPLILASKS
ncbi:unnamed protein product [Notodromas monacha]|uniref:Uncharacterized protein n=1 Tax=Notodromas monacha TaxID=399045 RepID=A0A7R9BUU1_9CRUS|nr:unnamed protein product [Notodromas monacha]CAG0921777.1 unnamed protein product [Notodromas monacha]